MDEKLKYRISGKCRKVGAIGIFQNFSKVVWAVNSETAKNLARDEMYASNFEHVMILKVEVELPNLPDLEA